MRHKDAKIERERERQLFKMAHLGGKRQEKVTPNCQSDVQPHRFSLVAAGEDK